MLLSNVTWLIFVRYQLVFRGWIFFLIDRLFKLLIIIYWNPNNEKFQEWSSHLSAKVKQIEQIQHEELVIQESNAGVSHPKTVMIYSEYTVVADITMLRSWRHDLLTSFTPSELADFWKFEKCRMDICASLSLKSCGRLKF